MTVATARRLDGRALRDDLLAALAAAIDAAGRPPITLGTVLVGADRHGRWAMSAKHRAAAAVGIRIEGVECPVSATQGEVDAAVAALAADPSVHGIFVQLPFPDHLDPSRTAGLVPPAHDVDGLTDRSPHPPATAVAVLRLLAWGGIETTGRHVVIVGDGRYVADPLARLLAERATVTRVAPGAADLATVTRHADVLVSAAGVAGSIGPDAVRPGATVVDTGATYTPDGVVGDVTPDVELVAGAVVPMPGGVGPVTIASLLERTARAAGVGH